ncbi:hypothetical protein ACFX14_033966 [Malus domestica]
MPDAFTDLMRMTKSHIPVANVPAKMDVPNDSLPRNRKLTAQALEEPTVNPIVTYSFYPTHKEIKLWKLP